MSHVPVDCDNVVFINRCRSHEVVDFQTSIACTMPLWRSTANVFFEV